MLTYSALHRRNIAPATKFNLICPYKFEPLFHDDITNRRTQNRSKVRTGLTPRVEAVRRSVPVLENGLIAGKAVTPEIPPRKQSYSSIRLPSEYHFNSKSIDQATRRTSYEALIIKKSRMDSRRTSTKTAPNISPMKSISPMRKRKRDSVTVKEASRNKDWVGKAKGQIHRDFNRIVNSSNAMQITAPAFHYTYKYYVGKGNNSSLVRQILTNRNWWVRVSEKENANLVWTQWKDQEFLDSIPVIGEPKYIEDPVKRGSVVSHTAYLDPKRSFNSMRIVDISSLGFDRISSSASYKSLVQNSVFDSTSLKMHNRLSGNSYITDKKGLFYSLKEYCAARSIDLFRIIPVTFHVTGTRDTTFTKFSEYFATHSGYWIVKPGEDTNRGDGIKLCSEMAAIKIEVSKGDHTYIIQKYIENPFLIHNRKFDIRCFAMITVMNGVVQGYYYSEGYLRTSSFEFSLNVHNKYVHLTNDAVQKKSESYGKHESGNKMSYSDFQRYLDHHFHRSVNFQEEVLSQIKEIVQESFRAVYQKVSKPTHAHMFEILGYDFIIDEHLKPWLLEVNTNPCLELSSTLLARVIPAMIENSFRIAIDPIFQEPYNRKGGLEFMENKYELIFHSVADHN